MKDLIDSWGFRVRDEDPLAGIGTTNITAGAIAALALFEAKPPPSSVNETWSSGCGRAAVLITDGHHDQTGAGSDGWSGFGADSGLGAAADTIVGLNNNLDAPPVWFTYTLGAESDTTVAHRLACGTDGLYAHIDVSADMQTQMLGPLGYFSLGPRSGSADLVWTEPYIDSSGAGLMTTVARAVYTSTNDADSHDLLGVVGIDVLISDIEDAAEAAGIDVITALSRRRAQCTAGNLKGCALSNARKRHGPSSRWCSDGDSDSNGGSNGDDAAVDFDAGESATCVTESNTDVCRTTSPPLTLADRCTARTMPYDEAACGSVCDVMLGSSSGDANDAINQAVTWDLALPAGVVGSGYEMQIPGWRFNIRNTVQNASWSHYYRNMGELPAGLGFDDKTGRITGVPTSHGQFEVNFGLQFYEQGSLDLISKADVRAADGEFPVLTILERPPFKVAAQWNASNVAIDAEVCNEEAEHSKVSNVYCFYRDSNYDFPGPLNVKYMYGGGNTGLFATAAAAADTGTGTAKLSRFLPTSKEELYDNAAGSDYDAISYKLDWGGSGGSGSPGESSFLVDTVNGHIRAKPSADASINQLYTAALVAVDANGYEAEVYRWSFLVIEKPEFMVVTLERSIYISGKNLSQSATAAAVGKGDVAVIERLSVASPNRMYTVGNTYQFTAVDTGRSVFINAASSSESNDDEANGGITFTMKGAPNGFLVDPGTGLIQGTVSNDMVGMHNISFLAVDSAGDFALAQTIAFNVSYEDVQVETNGPNGFGCNVGTRVDLDGNFFDGAFTCDCAHTKYEGENCQILADDSNVAMGVGVGVAVSFIVILAVVVAAMQCKAKWARMKPVDFVVELERMVADGSLPATLNKHVIPDEVRRKDVTLMDLLGKGAFGEVKKGLMKKSGGGRSSVSSLIAVKLCHALENGASAGGVAEAEIRNSAAVIAAAELTMQAAEKARAEMVREAAIMAQVGHHDNLVSLIGVVTSGEPYMLLLSYCHNGALLQLLQRSKELRDAANPKASSSSSSRNHDNSTETGADGYTRRGSATVVVGSTNFLVDEGGAGIYVGNASTSIKDFTVEIGEETDGGDGNAKELNLTTEVGEAAAVCLSSIASYACC